MLENINEEINRVRELMSLPAQKEKVTEKKEYGQDYLKKKL